MLVLVVACVPLVLGAVRESLPSAMGIFCSPTEDHNKFVGRNALSIYSKLDFTSEGILLIV